MKPSSLDFPLLSQTLVATAMGREPADTVIRDGVWVCVQSGEFISHVDIAIKNERIALVSRDASHTIGPATRVIHADGRFLLPGLIDAHMHVESGMLTISQFVSAVLPHGTTCMIIDPHEIANVFGIDGVRVFVEEAQMQPNHVWVQVPSCVPAAPGMETPGAVITPQDVAEALTWKGIIGLGELMNFPGVISGDEKVHAEITYTRQAGKNISGHYASPDLNLPFLGYVAGGPQDDHEGTTIEDALNRARQGMKVLLRYGSAWHDVDAGVQAIKKYALDSRHFLLCTDDCHCHTLVEEGHVDRAVKQAMHSGLDAMTAIQMATINSAEHFGISNDVGQIAPGRYADILIVSDLDRLVIDMVIAKGQMVAQAGKALIEPCKFNYPTWTAQSVHVSRHINPEDFMIIAPQQKMRAHVIGIIENQAPTRHLLFEVNASDGEIKPDLQRDLAKIAIVERHSGKSGVSNGLVHGFGFNAPCAVASTVAHDSHNLIVVGTDETNMALAANELVRMQGGQVVVRDKQVIGKVSLPLAGIMSNAPAYEVAEQASSILEGFKQCGCSLNNPNMQLSLLALVVIPELRLSDLGLFDVNQFRFIPLLEPID